MIESLILLSVIGSLIGLFSGLIPGIHTNTLAALIIPLYPYFSLSPLEASVIISAIMSSHTFASFIPAALLGAPDENNALSVLPAHKLLLAGRGLDAITLMVIGAASALLLSASMIFFISGAFSDVYASTRPFIHYILAAITAALILGERKAGKILFASTIFLMSGVLGFLVLDTRLLPVQDAMLPMLSGLFGVSTLLVSVEKKAAIPKQVNEDVRLGGWPVIKFVAIGTAAGLFVGLMPGIGASQAVVMAQSVFAVSSPEGFLVMLGAVNSADSVFSMSALYTVGNPRSGASVAVRRILGEVGLNEMILLTGSIMLSAGMAAFLALKLSRHALSAIQKINYSALSFSVIAFISLLAFVFSGIMGLLVLATSTSIGVLCERFGVRRMHCMGSLLLPTMLFFSGNVNAFASLAGLAG